MIRLEDVNLQLKEQVIFKNLNLHLKKNKKILLRMPSGAGKSTLLKIIMGYIPLNSGKIIIISLSLFPVSFALVFHH